MKHRFIKKIHPLSGDIFPWMQEFVEFVSISPRQRSLSRLKNKRWIFPGGSRDNVLSSTSSTDKWSSSAVTSLGRYYRAPILSPPNTERDRSPSTETSLLPRYPCLYYLTSYILVKLIRRVKCNNFDGIFQFLKFPPIFKYKYSRYSSLPSWILRTTNISNYLKFQNSSNETIETIQHKNPVSISPPLESGSNTTLCKQSSLPSPPREARFPSISTNSNLCHAILGPRFEIRKGGGWKSLKRVKMESWGGRGKGPKGKVEGLLLRIFSR